MKEQVRAPERDLALAMLEDAVMCFKKYLKSTREKERHIFDETEEWFLRDDQHWVFSFLNLCDFLGLDAGFLRQGTSSLEGRCFERPGRGHFQSRDGARRYLE